MNTNYTTDNVVDQSFIVEPCDVSELVHNTLLNTDIKTNGSYMYVILKRFFDIVLSVIAIVVLSPLMLVVSVIIYIDDKGSPIFVQQRYTQDGKIFKMYKFRSMYVDAEERFNEVKHLNEIDGNIIFKSKDDPRITRIGKFIRKTSIDELPQLFNILKGDMSIVGPRPPITREVVQYTSYQMNRLLVKGGLTCFWQCSGRSNLNFDEQVELDIKYIKNRSLFLDFKLILKTVKTVLKMDGAL
ncbi:MAG: sugar transferase [Oscillospiraceae bacterium]